MQIARKEFKHPDGFFERTTDLFEWLGFGCKPEHVWVAKTLEEVRAEATAFVDAVGPQNLVSICEYSSKKHVEGDDGVTHFVVWYWENVVSDTVLVELESDEAHECQHEACCGGKHV